MYAISLQRARSLLTLNLKASRRDATSLQELVLVSVIISIAAALTVPRFSQVVARQRLESSVRRVGCDIQLARQRARTTSVSHRLRFQKNTSRYHIEQKTGKNTWTQVADLNHAASSYTVDLDKPPYQTTVSKTNKAGSLSDTLIVFDGYGEPQEDTWIILQAGAFFKKITLHGDTGIIDVADVPSASQTVGQGLQKQEKENGGVGQLPG